MSGANVLRRSATKKRLPWDAKNMWRIESTITVLSLGVAPLLTIDILIFGDLKAACPRVRRGVFALSDSANRSHV
jgi:hypothetical protein